MSEALLEFSDLRVHYPVRGAVVKAVDGVSLRVGPGETVGLVGESGCGKSTLGRSAMGLVPVTSGAIRLDGQEVAGRSRAALRPLRPVMQMIFQDPYASLNPRMSVGRILEEPLIVHRRGDAAQRRERVRWLMEKVGLRPEAAARHPHEFSGGQRQRIGIARALALAPRLVICDEPVSALDVSVRAQVINLLMDLKSELGLAYLFISHDLSIVRHVSDRIAVMYLGRVVEAAPADELFARPAHPYTKALLAASPVPDPAAVQPPTVLEGGVPSPAAPPPGCHFAPRCAFAEPRCRAEPAPALEAIAPAHHARCWRARELGSGGG